MRSSPRNTIDTDRNVVYVMSQLDDHLTPASEVAKAM